MRKETRKDVETLRELYQGLVKRHRAMFGDDEDSFFYLKYLDERSELPSYLNNISTFGEADKRPSIDYVLDGLVEMEEDLVADEKKVFV